MRSFPRLFCSRRAGLFAAAVAIVTGLMSGRSEAAGETFRDLRIEVVGSGRPVLMIPGLNSAGSVWTETCVALQPGVQCHIVQLPGFAGAPAVWGTPPAAFLEAMRDRLLAYADERRLVRPVVVGHSLGGTLALMMAAEAPQRLDRLVIVDSLPFLLGILDAGATAERARGVAEGMRAQMQQAAPAQWEAQIRTSATSMTRDPALQQRVIDWGLASDRATSTQAMIELWGGDLRPLLPKIERPVLVLGAWAAFAPRATLESTRQIFEQQYAGLAGVQIRMSERGFHFLMWDDPTLVQGEIRAFLR